MCDKLLSVVLLHKMQMRKLIEQIMKFGIVGVIATAIDAGLLIVFKEFCHIDVLWAAFFSFTISLLFNYVASMRYVFVRQDDISRQKEFTIFVILSVMGLGINQFGMWVFTKKFPIHYLLAKALVTGVVMIWNFVTRKIFLEKK